MSRTYAAPTVVGLLGLALLVAYLAAPQRQWAELLAAGAPALAALALAITTIVVRPSRPAAWLITSMGIAVLAAARIAGSYEWYGSTGPVFPGAYHATAVLAYPALVLGILGTRPDKRRSDGPLAGGEPVIYAVVATALVWLAFTGPYAAGEELPLPDWAWIALNPALMVGVGVLIWFRMAVYSQYRRLRWSLLAGASLVGAGELAHNWLWAADDQHPSGWETGPWMLGPLAIAIVVTLPGMRRFMATPGESRPASWSQLVALLVASVAALAVLVVVAAMAIDSTASRAVVCVTALLVVVLAVLESRRLAAEIRDYVDYRGAERLAAMVEHSSDVVLLSDAGGVVSYASPGIMSMLGLEPDEVVGRHVLALVSEDDRPGLDAEFARLVTLGHGATFEFESDVVHADGQLRKATAVVANLLGSDAVNGIVATFRDVTEQRNLERQLSHRAFHDELTGLANRALFLDRMDHALRVTRSETDPVVVLFVDLDDFKRVNDSLGHGIGDQVLQAVAARIRRSAGTGDTAARLGGDEFAILLEDRGGIDRAITVAEGLLEELTDPINVGGHDVSVLASVGVAVAAPGISTSSLLRDADVAMYEAKRAGKGQIRIFDPAMRLVASKHLTYRGQLGEALDRGELRLVYMPYVDLRTGQVTGAEALVRWMHPEFGEISAAEFVPIAERSGLIVPMGNWILDHGLAHASRWRAGQRLYVSFNISPIQIKQPDFADTVLELVGRHGVDPGLVVLEVNETVLAEENGRVRDTFGRLSERGIRFAVDDFGSGSASLAYIQRYPVDLIKIDSAEVASFGENPAGGTLTKMILQMADSLGVLTVAEGIETTRQLNELRRWGCDLGQGYLLSHPIEAEELERRFSPADAARPA